MFDLGQAAAEQQRLLDEYKTKFGGKEDTIDGELLSAFFAAVFGYESQVARHILRCMGGKAND